MSVTIAQKRATMPSGTNKVLDRRSLEHGNEKLIPFLKKDLRVLDVGCGSGTITKGIAELVGLGGKVVGLDMSKELIEQATKNFSGIDQLSFVCGDIFSYMATEKFDVISSARTLQWLSNPLEALMKMKTLVKTGGLIHILDYNHEKIEWIPAPPDNMSYFYRQFLAWRSEAKMHNRIGDELPTMMDEISLHNITTVDANEVVSSEDFDFRETASIWTKVAELRGVQMVREGYVTEEERLAAIKDYNEWLNTGMSMKMYLRSVSGFN